MLMENSSYEDNFYTTGLELLRSNEKEKYLQGIQYLREAAKLNNVKAQYLLGQHYETGNQFMQ